MKRLRATVDIYVDLDLLEDHGIMTEEDLEAEAKDEVNRFIDGTNKTYFDMEVPVSMSEIISYEIYDDGESDD